MRHLLAARASERSAFEIPPEYELNEVQAEALLDDGIVELCELHSADDMAVYHVTADFASNFHDCAAMWTEVEDRLCRAKSIHPSVDGSHVLIIGGEVQLRGLSQSEAERLEDEGVVYPDKYFRGRGRTLYHVDPDFTEHLAPGENVADAIEAQLDTVPCRHEERTRTDAEHLHASSR